MNIVTSSNINTYFFFGIFKDVNSSNLPKKEPIIVSTNSSENNHSLIEKLHKIIDENLINVQFGVEDLAKEAGISRSHLHRKLHKLTDKSISQFIREYKLSIAKKMLLTGDKNTSEVAHVVGFGSLSYFSKCFSEFYGYSPSKARENQHTKVAKTYVDAGSKKRPYLKISSVAMVLLVAISLLALLKPNMVNQLVTNTKNKSIVVIPFKNLNQEADNEYLANGMSEAINRHLMTIKDVDVISPLAFPPKKEEAKFIDGIKKSNKANHILLGSIQQENNKLRVEVKLIEVRTNKLLWAKSYDRQNNEVLAMQNEIANAIVREFQINLTENERIALNKKKNYKPEAYDNYLKGFYYHSFFTPETQLKAHEHFSKALSIDSTMAPAHFGLSTIFLAKASFSISELEANEAYILAKPYMDKAIELDPNFYDTYSAVAFSDLNIFWNFEKSEKFYLKALKSDNPVIHWLYTHFLLKENRHVEALEYAEKTFDRFPYYPNSVYADHLFFNSKIENGKTHIEDRINLNPNNYYTLEAASRFYLNILDYSKAIYYLQKLIDTYQSRSSRILGLMGAANAKKGNQKKAKMLLRELKELKLNSAGSPAWFISIIYSALDEKEKALDYLETAVNNHEMEITWLVSEPLLYPLHGHPRFDALVKKVGFRPHAYPIKK